MADPAMVVGLAALLPVGTAVWAGAVWPHLQRGQRVGVGASLAVLAAMAGVAWSTSPTDLPIEVVQVVHEGGSELVLHALDGANGHAGLWFQALGDLAPRDTPGWGLRWLAWVNLLASVTVALMVAVLASVRARSVIIGLLAVVGLLARPCFQHAALSEVGGPWAALFVVGALATFGLKPRIARETGRPDLQLGLVWAILVGSWGIPAALCRTGAALPALALAVAAVVVTVTSDTWRANLRARLLNDLPHAIVTQPRVRWAVVGALAVAWLTPRLVRGIPAELEWGVHAAMVPLPDFLPVLVWFLTDGYLVWVLLAVLGGVVGLLRPTHTALLPLAFMASLRMYGKAGHGVHIEMARYIVPLLPIVALGAADGMRWVLDQLKRRDLWPSMWPIVVAVGVMLSSVRTVPTHEPPPQLVDPNIPLTDAVHVLDGDNQREARFFLEASKDPHLTACTWVSRVWSDVHARTSAEASPGQLVVRQVGRRGWRPIPSMAAARAEATDTCLVYVRTLDCALPAATQACAADMVGGEVQLERSWPRVPYHQPKEYGMVAGEVTVAMVLLQDQPTP